MSKTRERMQRAAAVYAEPGKDLARLVVIEIARAYGAKTILDLWGGGESARSFRAVIPDAAVISAERDESQWPALIQDAQQNRYGYHLGNVAEAPGKYDMIWLDLCGMASKSMAELLASVSPKLNPDGTLVVTVMPARENDTLISGRMRLRVLPMWLEDHAKCSVRFLLPYPRGRGQSMWVVAMQPTRGSLFGSETSFQEIVENSMGHEGYLDYLFLSHPREDGMGSWSEPLYGLGKLIESHPAYVPPAPPLTLSELTPDQRNIVTTLIDAAAAEVVTDRLRARKRLDSEVEEAA